MSRDEANAARGLVKHKGKWVLPQEVELLEEAESQSAEEKDWYRKVKQWHTWLRDGATPERPNEWPGPVAGDQCSRRVPAVARHLGRDPEEQVRLLATRIFGQIRVKLPPCRWSIRFCRTFPPPCERRRSPRCAIAIRFVRDRRFQRALKHELNFVVNRAAAALGVLGTDEQVPALIDALTTEHRYTIMVQDPSSTIGVRSDGQFAPTNVPVVPPDIAGMLATGQLPQG